MPSSRGDRSQVAFLKNKRATEKERARKEVRLGSEQQSGREGSKISTSSIINSCSFIGCRYIQTLPRKDHSLCRRLCRPSYFSRYSSPSPPPVSLSPLLIFSCVLLPPSLTPSFLLNLVSLPWKRNHISVPMEDAANTQRWKKENIKSKRKKERKKSKR